MHWIPIPTSTVLDPTFTLVSCHALAWFDMNRLSYHHGINTYTTEASQTKPACKKLPDWHGSAWLGFLLSIESGNSKTSVNINTERSMIKNVNSS